MKPFPSLDQVDSTMLREETQRSLLLYMQAFTEAVAMALKKGNNDAVYFHYGKLIMLKLSLTRLQVFLQISNLPNQKGVLVILWVLLTAQSKLLLGKFLVYLPPQKSLSQLSCSKEHIQKLMTLLSDQSTIVVNSTPCNATSSSQVNTVGIDTIPLIVYLGNGLWHGCN